MGTFKYSFRPTSPKYHILRVLGSPEALPEHILLCLWKTSQPTTACCQLPLQSVLASTDKASSTRLSWISKELLFKKSDWPCLFWLELRSFLLSSFAGGLEAGSSCLEWRSGKMLREWLPSTGIAGSIQYYCLQAVPLDSSGKGLSRANGWKGRILFHEALSFPSHVLGNIPQIPPAWIIPYSCLRAVGSFYPTHLSTAAHGTVLRHNSETTTLG